MNRRSLVSRPSGPAAVIAGLAVLLTSGVLVSLLAARMLAPDEYTVFAAFFGLFGVLVLAPASSLEQESVLRGSTGSGSAPMLRRASLVWVAVAVVVALPLFDWQQRLLGTEPGFALVGLVMGAPVVLALAVLRGLALGGGKFGVVAAAHFVAGVGTLLLPLALYVAGVPSVMAFVLGAAFAWVPALALVLLTGWSSTNTGSGASVAGATIWLVGVNLLVLFNLSAVPPILRWHVLQLGVVSVADAQLLVSVSRLATTAVLATLPLVLRAALASRAAGRHPLPASALALSVTIGVGSTLVTTLFGRQIVEMLTGRASTLPLSTCLLVGLPALFLCPAIVLMAATISRGAYASTCAAWGIGGLILLVTGAADPGPRLDVLLGGIAAAAAAPLVVLALLVVAPAAHSLSGPGRRGGLMRSRRGGS